MDTGCSIAYIQQELLIRVCRDNHAVRRPGKTGGQTMTVKVRKGRVQGSWLVNPVVAGWSAISGVLATSHLMHHEGGRAPNEPALKAAESRCLLLATYISRATLPERVPVDTVSSWVRCYRLPDPLVSQFWRPKPPVLSGAVAEALQ